MSKELPRQNVREGWVLVVTVLASSMAFIDATALNVVLPAIQTDLQATGSGLLWIVNSYALVTAALILLGGEIGDRWGRTRVFGGGIALFVVASVVCGLAVTTRQLITARAIQGLGAALMIPGSLGLIAATFEPARRGRAIGIWSACSVIMTALGPIVGGLLADAGWWRGIFYINLPIGMIALIVLSIMGPASRTERPLTRVDYLGALLAVTALASLNFGLIRLTTHHGNDFWSVAAWLASGIALVAFCWNEATCHHPLIPLGLLRKRAFWAASQMTICFYCGLYGMLFFLALNLVQVQKYSAAAAGLAQLPVMLLVIASAPLAGVLVDRFGPRVPLGCGGLLGMLGFLWLARTGVTAGPVAYWETYFPALVLLGLAMGMTAAPLSTTIMNCADQTQLGLASGLNASLSRLSSVLGLAILGSIALPWFSHTLAAQVADLGLDAAALESLQQQSRRFADAAPPAGISPALAGKIQQAIQLAFVDAFHVVATVSAGAVMMSTLLALALLGKPHRTVTHPPSDNGADARRERPQSAQTTSVQTTSAGQATQAGSRPLQGGNP